MNNEHERCKNCRWWGRLEIYGPSQGECQKEGDEKNHIKVLGWDYEGPLTGPEFGCVHFEVKP